MFVLYYRRRLSVMSTDLANRTGQHSNSSDSSEVDNQSSQGTSSSAEFSPETIVHNPLYVNFNPGHLNINITRQNISLSKISNRDTEHVYQEPSDSLKH